LLRRRVLLAARQENRQRAAAGLLWQALNVPNADNGDLSDSEAIAEHVGTRARRSSKLLPTSVLRDAPQPQPPGLTEVARQKLLAVRRLENYRVAIVAEECAV
jgi:hypothetical protein